MCLGKVLVHDHSACFWRLQANASVLSLLFIYIQWDSPSWVNCTWGSSHAAATCFVSSLRFCPSLQSTSTMPHNSSGKPIETQQAVKSGGLGSIYNLPYIYKHSGRTKDSSFGLCRSTHTFSFLGA